MTADNLLVEGIVVGLTSWFLLRYLLLLAVAVAVAFMVLYFTEPKAYHGVEVTARTTAQARWVRGIPVSNSQETLGLKLVYDDQRHIGYASSYQSNTGYLNAISPDDTNPATPTLLLTPLTQPSSVPLFVNSLDMSQGYVLYGSMQTSGGLILATVNGSSQLTTEGTMDIPALVAQFGSRYHAVIVSHDDQTRFVIFCFSSCYTSDVPPDTPTMIAYKFVSNAQGQTVQSTFQQWTQSQMPFQLITSLRGTKDGFLMMGNTGACPNCTQGPVTLLYVPLSADGTQFTFQTASATVLPDLPPSNAGGTYYSTMSFGLAASADGLTVAAQNNYVVPEIWIFSLASGTLTRTQVIPQTVLNCQFGNTLAFSNDGNNLAVYGASSTNAGSWLVHVFPRLNSGASQGQYSTDPSQYSSIYSVTPCTLASDGYFYPNIVTTTHVATGTAGDPHYVPPTQRVIFATRDPAKGPQFYRIQNFSAPWTPLP